MDTYQDIPEFDQTTECVVQLEPEVREYEVFYPCAVVKLPAEAIQDEVIAAPIEKGLPTGKVMPVDARSLPISEDGTVSREDLIAQGWEIREVEEVSL